jgi:hypothetical protein
MLKSGMPIWQKIQRNGVLGMPWVFGVDHTNSFLISPNQPTKNKGETK